MKILNNTDDLSFLSAVHHIFSNALGIRFKIQELRFEDQRFKVEDLSFSLGKEHPLLALKLHTVGEGI